MRKVRFNTFIVSRDNIVTGQRLADGGRIAYRHPLKAHAGSSTAAWLSGKRLSAPHYTQVEYIGGDFNVQGDAH